MPLYQFLCDNTHTFERVLKIKDYDEPQACPECKAKAKRQIVGTMIAPEFQEYQSPIDGSVISTKRKQKEDMAVNGCVPYEASMKDESTRNMKSQESALDRKVDKHVDKMWAEMNSKQRDNLARELASGADVNYLRQ